MKIIRDLEEQIKKLKEEHAASVKKMIDERSNELNALRAQHKKDLAELTAKMS